MAFHNVWIVIVGLCLYVPVYMVDGQDNLPKEFHLTIIHTNDVHSHFMESNADGRPCDPGEECFGGAARRETVIKQIREQRDNVLLLDAGDQSQGSPWYNVYKGAAAAHFLHQLDYTAFTIGNHEFDRGVDSFVENFVQNVTQEERLPILGCNIDASLEPVLIGKFACSHVVEIDGVKIGLIGYTTEDTPNVSDSGKLIFNDVVSTVQTEAQRLRADENCHIVIGIGHYGYQNDRDMAELVDLDVIIGGHSHSLLWSGDTEDNGFDESDIDSIAGAYPTFETNQNGRILPICHVFQFGKYLGNIDLTFHQSGGQYVLNDESDVTGQPILLDSSIVQDPEILAELNRWEIPVSDLMEDAVGQTLVTLDGKFESCRRKECNMGNFITDAILKDQHIRATNTGSPLCSMAIYNGGGIRASIPIGEISFGDVLTVFPFEATIDQLYLRGQTIKKVFEHSVSQYIENADDLPGEFLQVSGFKVVFDMSKSSGERVNSLLGRCADCDIPVFTEIEDAKEYCVLTSDFVAGGGDGFHIIPEEAINQTTGGLDSDSGFNW